MAEETKGIVKQNAFISDRHRLETITTKSAADYTLAGVCAIVALLVYGLLLALQWMDYLAYQFQ